MRWLAPFIVAIVALPLLAVPTGDAGGPGGKSVLLADVEGVITQGTLIHVRDAIAEAESRGVPLVLRLETPGGLVDATLEIHQAIIASRVPVMTWVGPPGSFAASAGTLMLLMGQPNGMASSTTIGSAQPITVDPSGGSEPASEKVENFVVEQVRIMAERTGRNVTQAVRFVTDNDNLGPQDALDGGIIDVIADDVPSFLVAVDGMTALTRNGNVTLDTDGARIDHHGRSLLSRTVDILGNPQISFLLILAGTYALIFGLANPGTYVPETIGALLLLLGFVGLGLFSANTAGILLLLLAVLFFVIEVFTPTHGVLSIAGAISLFFAALFLINEPLLPTGFLQRFYFAGLALAVVSGGFVFGAVTVAMRARERPAFDVLRGARGTTIEDVGPSGGRVEVHGEIWKARSETPIATGTDVRVVRREDLVLEVAAMAQDAEE